MQNLIINTNMEFSKNQRGNTVLTYLGFEYNKFRKLRTTGVTTWRCNQFKSSHCKAFIRTNEGSIVGEPSVHSHDSCPQKAKANIAMRTMKNNIKQVGATARNVIGNELISLNINVLSHLPKQSSISRNLQRHKIRDHLPNPSTFNFDIPENYAHLIYMIQEWRILIDATNTIYGDGIFDKVPKMFFSALYLACKSW